MPTFPLQIRSARSRIALALCGAALLAFAGCNDDTNAAADAVVNKAADVKVAQADTSSSTPDTSKAPEASGSVDVEKLMQSEALPDVVLGKADAPVTIVEYASMTCPHCAEFHADTLPAIKKEFVDTGKAKLILREFPFDPRALAAFMLARCTGSDEKRTAMVDVLFNQQSEWAQAENASEALLRIAKLAGMTQEQFTSCLNDKDLQQKVVSVQQRGQDEFGVSATPTFFVNGDKYAGALTADQMAAVINKHL